MSHNHDDQREHGTMFMPKFDSSGLISAAVSEAGTGTPLMFAYMNQEALELSLKTGEAHFFSRSRQEIWHKGGTSGNVLAIEEIRIDCDQDAIWIIATPKGHGAACHTGRKSCFYRHVTLSDGTIELQHDDSELMFDPSDVYKS